MTNQPDQQTLYRKTPAQQENETRDIMPGVGFIRHFDFKIHFVGRSLRCFDLL